MVSQKVIIKDTLLRYNNPIVVSKHSEKPQTPITGVDTHIPPPGKSKTDLSMLAIDKNQSIEDVLNCIFPPKEWEENGKLWMQTVSSEPVTKENVMELAEELDTALCQQGAQETGICPIRRKLFDQGFDELVRQEAINCCERGLLLKLIRDDLRMEMNTFEALYQSNIAYALRKTLLVEEEKLNMKESIAARKEKKTSLENEITELHLKIEQIELKETEQREVAEEEHTKEVELLKQDNQKLKEKLEKVILPVPKK